MDYTYQGAISASEDGWYVDFPDFDGGCFADGNTIEEACKNAAETLRLTIATYIDDSKRLPPPTFCNLPQAVFTVEVSNEYVAVTKCMTPTQAADELGVSVPRIIAMIDQGILEPYQNGGQRLVTIASVNERKANPVRRGRPTKA